MAIMIASTVLGRLDFVGFAAVFFVAQLALLGPILLWSRQRAGAWQEKRDEEVAATRQILPCQLQKPPMHKIKDQGMAAGTYNRWSLEP